MRWLLMVGLAGCPWVGGDSYERRVEDVDEDGERAVRFGGQDCDDADASVVDCDLDNDGHLGRIHGGEDCDDDDPTIHPDASERCGDAIDNDCDGLIDGDDEVSEDALLTFHADADGDGFGAATPTLACEPPPGFVVDATDCDDSRSDTNPGALERCDPLDHDCDGDVHADAADAPLWYADLDADGYAGAFSALACERPDPALVDDALGIDCDDADAAIGLCDADGDGQDGVAVGGPDCDDSSATTFDGAPELCDERDNDCDGSVDEDLHFIDIWPDLDGDGAGNALILPQPTCAGVTAGFADNADDCDDANANVYIGRAEICDGIDNDCDGLPDEADSDLDLHTLNSWFLDGDLDGYGDPETEVLACSAPAGHVSTAGDCNDDTADISPDPDTLEICNTLDDDCDGEVDENAIDAPQYYVDGDGDGHGSLSVPIRACSPAVGIAATADDCNDADSSVYPGAPEVCGDTVRQDCSDAHLDDCDGDGDLDTEAGGTDCDDENPAILPGVTEICDGLDNDCDSLIDDQDDDVDQSTAQNWFSDLDDDGFGAGAPIFACTPPPQSSNVTGDCDDDAPAINPGAAEICDTIDNNCSGSTDIDDPAVTSVPDWYRDLDEDGYGAGLALHPVRCIAPTGFVGNDDDCDDILPSINPDGVEVCNGRDDDCDGLDDIGATDAPTFYLDADGDGFGSASTPIDACQADPTVGIVADLSDCNDGDPTVFPGAHEVCYDAIRQDCSAADLNDCDADGAIGEPAGGPDCDDEDALVNEDAVEVCDGLDNDCDGLLDDADPDVDAGSAVVWFLDADSDGHGDLSHPLNSCAQPAGYVLASDDCDDQVFSTHPGADELCNGVDDDCNGADDDGPINAPSWYPDGDGDGFGIASSEVESCTAPAAFGWSLLPTDCNDALVATHPGADELCDGADNDCNGINDDFPIDGSTYYADFDGDGFGAPSQPIVVCNPPAGLVPNANDCNDADPHVNPDAPEICYDSVRQDCSTAHLDDCDADGVVDEGHGGTDCDDTRPEVLPGAQEICDGLDNDCDTLLDDADPSVDLSSATDWYPDDDGDGWGVVAGSQNACNQPTGFVLQLGDCDDTSHDVNPDAPEVCGGGDEDCDGHADDADPDGPTDPPTWYRDNDGDGHGDTFVSFVQCATPAGTWVQGLGDCNDTNPHVNPLAIEVCNSLDDDCDALQDDDDPGVTGQTTWFRDADGDGASVATGGILACDAPANHIAPSAEPDCNDAVAAIFPGADEVCNGGVDDDCDGHVDAADPSVVDTVVWYDDGDDDGYGDPNDSTNSCNQPAGHLAFAGDCNDAASGVNPGSPEVCDGIDNDCDGGADDADPDTPLNPPTWLQDFDDDGHGDGSDPRDQCLAPGPTWKIIGGGDCDDTRAAVFPGADEVCDTEDNDCDGLTDDADPGAIDRRDWFLDHDGDGRAAFDAVAVRQCFAPPLHGENLPLTDCLDTDPLAFLGANEIYYNGIDNDCLGLAGEYDQDGDSVLHPSGGGTDCDDTDPTISPLQAEVFYNGVDQDCDGLSDFDQDLDGFDAPGDCLDDPSGDVARALAGQPAANEVNSGATEVWYDTIDQDCDGHDDFDQDGDGFAVLLPASWPFAYNGLLPATDCDDQDALTKPQDTVITVDDAAAVQTVIDQTCTGTLDFQQQISDIVWTVSGRTITMLGYLGDYTGTGGTLLTVEDTEHPQFPGERIDSHVTLIEMGLAEGNSSGNGGCLRIRGGQKLTMEDSLLYDCVANRGAGVYLEAGAELAASGESIQSNFAIEQGGAIYAEPGARITLEDMTISQNQGTIPGVVANDVASLTVRNVNFSQNVGVSSAAFGVLSGWDLAITSIDGAVLVQDSLFVQEEVADQGGDSMAVPSLSIDSVDTQAVVDGITVTVRAGGVRTSGNVRIVNSALIAHPDRDTNSRSLLSHRNGDLVIDHSVFHQADRGSSRGILVDLASLTMTNSYLSNLGEALDVDCDLGPFSVAMFDNAFETDDFGNPPTVGFTGCDPIRIHGFELDGTYNHTTPTLQYVDPHSFSACANPDDNCVIPTDDHFQTFHEAMSPIRWDFHPGAGSHLEDGAQTGRDIGPFGQDGSWHDDVAPADGMPDAWVHLWSVSGTPTADQDNDGLDNLTEYLTGTIPVFSNTDLDLAIDGSDSEPLNPNTL